MGATAQFGHLWSGSFVMGLGCPAALPNHWFVEKAWWVGGGIPKVLLGTSTQHAGFFLGS